MNNRLKSVQNLLLEALEIESPSERAVFLSKACGEDLTLRQEIDQLIQAQEQAGRFLPDNPSMDGKCPGAGALESVGAWADAIESPNLLVTEKPGDWIGRYKLVEGLGQGGCGSVYLAEQHQPVRRQVALKVIKLGMDTRQVVARFEAERQALALMDHPNIAKVFDAGATETGRPYFVMELVRGIKITDYCDQNSLTTPERLELFIQVCQAVQHAHQKGVIHRDLKPSNILVTTRDGVAVPKVIDFGIAKATEGRLTGLTLLTAFEQFLGTPAYMSPEQAALTGDDVDTRSDIYSLGVLLYELLTGSTPFDTKALLAAGIDELRRTIRETEPLRPSARLVDQLESRTVAEVKSQSFKKDARAQNSRSSMPRTSPETKEIIKLVRGDLDWIVMKCLEKDRMRRYGTATDLAGDLQRHLKNEPVMARPPSRLYGFQKTVRRHKLGFAAAAAIMLTLLVGVLVSTQEAVQKEHERQRFQNNVVRQYVANGTRLVNEGDFFGALLWYTEALRLDAGNPRREQTHRIRIASVLQQCPRLLNVFSHGKMLYHSEFSPGGDKVLTASDDHTARLWDATSGTELLKLTHDGEVYDGRFSSNGLLIVTCSQDKTARVWDGRTGAPMHTLVHGDTVWQSCISHDNRLVATACEDGTARIWDLTTGQAVGPPMKHESRVDGLNFSADDRLLGTTTRNGRGYVWSVPDGRPLFQDRHFGNGILFSTDSRRFFTFDDQAIRCWQTDTWKEAPFSPIRFSNVYQIALSSDGQILAAATQDFTAQLFDARTGQAHLPNPVRHTGPILMVDVSPDGRRFATAGQDTVARLWSTSSGQPVGPPLKFIIHVKYVHFNPDGRRLLGSSCDQASRVWDLATAGSSTVRVRPTFENEHRLISPDGNYVLQVGQNNVVWITDTRSLKRVAALPHSDPVTYASISRDGHTAITSCERETAVSSMHNDIFLWDIPSGKRLNQVPMSHSFRLLYAAFSPDNTRLLTCGFDFTARLWDAHSGQPLSPPLWHREQVQWGAFSPNGKTMVTASWDRTVRVWDAAKGEPVTPPLMHKSIVRGAGWSSDGKRLYTVTTDDFLQIWDLAAGEPLTPPRRIQPGAGMLEAPGVQSGGRFEELSLDDRPVGDLVLLAQMLAVGRIDAGGNVVPLRLPELTDAWHTLHKRYPDQFATTTSDAVDWHRREAQDSESESNHLAALFHLDRAIERLPNDPGLKKMLTEAQIVPARDPRTEANQIDLSPFYNVDLHTSDGRDFGDIVAGNHTLGGVQFDIRGTVYVNGRIARDAGSSLPESITGIKVGKKCQRLHFLQGTGWDAPRGATVGKYVLHYADGQQSELPIVFGQDTEAWWRQGPPRASEQPGGAVPVWCGSNRTTEKDGCSLFLYKSTRENPRPDSHLVSIDLVSSMSTAAPFLAALTVE